jgi:hypothetical protein
MVDLSRPGDYISVDLIIFDIPYLLGLSDMVMLMLLELGDFQLTHYDHQMNIMGKME